MKMKTAGPGEKQLKDYLVACGKITALSDEEMAGAVEKLKGEDCVQKEGKKKLLIEKNLRTVIYTAAGYRGFGLTFANLIRNGNLGLIYAVNNWDGTGDFSQYLAWNIEGFIIDALVREKSSKGVL
ncbi:MAG TPA: sigma factor [Candidatus Goldiibacteriota bacterium]|nr:sigma factor [Candidatus Goldiibacteriota bacterium]